MITFLLEITKTGYIDFNRPELTDGLKPWLNICYLAIYVEVNVQDQFDKRAQLNVKIYEKSFKLLFSIWSSCTMP